MFLNMLGINKFGFLGMLFSSLGVFALSFADDDDDGMIKFKDQEALNDMVEKRLAKQKKKLLDEQEAKFDKMQDVFEDKISDLNDTLKELKIKKESNSNKDDPKIEGMQKTVDSLTKEMKKMTQERDDAVKNAEEIQSTNKEKTIENAVISLLSEKKVVAPQDIFLIIKEQKNIILDDKGNIIPVFTNTEEQVVGKEGKPMELSEFIDSWLKERPHFVAASGRTGSDATPGRHQPKSKSDGVIDEDHEPTLSEILSSKEHKELEMAAQADGSLQHGGADVE